MERGIRQGYPLSPFLFVLFLELFSGMITNLENEREIQEIKIGKLILAISHLFFADDILTFYRASVDQTKKLSNVWRLFVPGQIKASIR